jgi:hypothetical protein
VITPDIKSLVRERDGMCCTKCGMTNAEHLEEHGQSLHVHRTQPGSLYTLEGCVTLCVSCHGPEPKRASGEGPSAEGKRFVRLAPDVFAAMKAVALEGNRPLTREVRQALIEYLERKGMWPPPPAVTPAAPPARP